MSYVTNIKNLALREKCSEFLECETTLSSRLDLTMHRRMHTGQKPYADMQYEMALCSKAELLLTRQWHLGKTVRMK